MSGNLDIRFANDMPIAAVEVVAPDLTTVSRVMLSAGRMKTVPVPSEGSFLRVHLPTGRIVTLTADRGSLSRTITRAMIDATGVSGPTAPAWRGIDITTDLEGGMAVGGSADTVVYEDPIDRSGRRSNRPSQSMKEVELTGADTIVRVSDHQGEVLEGGRDAQGNEAAWELFDTPWLPPYQLQIEHPWGTLQVLLPANCRSMSTRAARPRKSGPLSVTVKLTSRERVADTILSYLSRGDLYSAEAMLEWADEAETLLEGKMQDPYGAAIGAYLLLKLRHFERLHNWAKNLADRFPLLPDGCVIWAWQLIHQDPTQDSEIRKYLIEAAARGLPVYTEGLGLLMDGLRLLGDDLESRALLESVASKISTVKWDSPVTAGFRTNKRARSRSVIYTIEFVPAS